MTKLSPSQLSLHFYHPRLACISSERHFSRLWSLNFAGETVLVRKIDQSRCEFFWNSSAFDTNVGREVFQIFASSKSRPLNVSPKIHTLLAIFPIKSRASSPSANRVAGWFKIFAQKTPLRKFTHPPLDTLRACLERTSHFCCFLDFTVGPLRRAILAVRRGTNPCSRKQLRQRALALGQIFNLQSSHSSSATQQAESGFDCRVRLS